MHATNAQKATHLATLFAAMLVFVILLILIAIASIGAYISPVIGIFATCVLVAILTIGVVFATFVIAAFIQECHENNH
ncbi:hypothetical protein SAMN02745664_101278 [Moraxella cuniculi DSM 21768]|uniref:Uncharacterized protein n=1 Tax=Moraxella cuniculi DSM 21768 TaxID=1122245 RepID=A0A1N7DHR2_9GAMM|nr:hypothetical protein [Moraxella cuniculi]OOS08072.1 hypothetical protein B0189_01695 [Moraxella cuniculi]SIR75403.1 hypothetical protein SAMN02745664_101278 [Moraxella cuniculi DSM 21768]